MLAVAEDRPLRWEIKAGEMSAAPETPLRLYLRIGKRIWLCSVGELYQRAMPLLISPKIAPPVLEAYLELSTHQGRVSGGHKTEKRRGQWAEHQHGVADRHWERSSLSVPAAATAKAFL